MNNPEGGDPSRPSLTNKELEQIRSILIGDTDEFEDPILYTKISELYKTTTVEEIRDKLYTDYTHLIFH